MLEGYSRQPGRAREFSGFNQEQVSPRWALPRASLDLRFNEGRYAVRRNGRLTGYTSLPALVAALGGTASRASSAWERNAAGVWVQRAAGELRERDYSAATGVAGFRRERQSTNLVKNPRCEGTIVGTPGTDPTGWLIGIGSGLSKQIVGSGVVDGMNYFDLRVFGTTTAAGQSITIQPHGSSEVVAAQGQAWTLSAFLARVAGSLPSSAELYVNEYSSAQAYLTNGGQAISVATALNRFSYTRTIANASTAFIRTTIYFFVAASGTAVDFTLRVAWPQVEQQPLATSPILPPAGTLATSTRTVDVLSLPTAGWLNPDGGVWLAEWEAGDRPAGVLRGIFAIDDGSAQNYLRAGINDSSVNTAVFAGGANVAPLVTANTGPGGSKLALRYALNDFAQCVNGGAALVDSAGAVPPITTLRPGSSATNTGPLESWLRRLTYVPDPALYNNAALQAATA